MNPHRPSLTQHRFQRLVLWTLALLCWIAAIFGGARAISPRHQRQRFDISLPWLTRRVGELLLIRAGQLVRRPRGNPVYWRHGRDRRRSHLMRTALGARVRRRLRHANACSWIANLIAVVRNLDRHAAALAKRLARGLTRIWRTWTPAAAICETPRRTLAAALAFADSS